MPSDSDLLFGKLSVNMGFCTQEALEGCLLIQAAGPDRLPLGRVLINEGYITEEQHSAVLTAQRKNMNALDPLLMKQRESVLFGKLAVREGLLSAEQVNLCLAQQATDPSGRSLGEIMVSRKFLTSAQVQDLLASQQKKIMSCPGCKMSFTVFSISQGKKAVTCPRCKSLLVDRKPGDSPRTDAEFATQVFRATKHELAPRSQTDSRILPAGAEKVTTRCVVCDQKLRGILDSTGRLRCPTCHSTFVPKT
jgi:Zn finger protein HypA/HybF involved in hydrogenase expression